MSSSWLMNVVARCWRPVERYIGAGGKEVADRHDALLSYRDLSRHTFGDFSMAVAQANQLLEDQSQIESGPYGTFVGIYDGHGGPEAAKFIKNNLFSYFTEFASEQGGVSIDVLRKAFNATEQGFESLVAKSWSTKPQIAAVGSCCLVGAIHKNTLYIANLGDSRAVLGSASKTAGAGAMAAPVQLTTEHNAAVEAVRQELKSLHPDDSRIVVLKHGVWRVKGIIQVSRSIGDVYLKKQEFNKEPLFARFRLSEPLHRPVLTAEPSIIVHKLNLQDQFVIFASDGLWEHLSNDDAVRLVCRHPRKGAARGLVRAALREAAKKREMRYTDLKKIDRGIRRHFHDDITVLVVFFDHKLMEKKVSSNDDGIIFRGVDHHSVSYKSSVSESF